jgi:type I restriction enzyme R subunit
VVAIAESHVEQAALAWLSELGYSTVNGLEISPDGWEPERATYGNVLQIERLCAAIQRLNPNLAPDTRADVLSKVIRFPADHFGLAIFGHQ